MRANRIAPAAICLIAATCWIAPAVADQADRSANGQAHAESDVGLAVDRAIPFLKRKGVAWIEKRGCVSCHQVPLMLWSLRSAQEKGFDVDPAELQSWQQWSTEIVNFVKPERKPDIDEDQALAANIDTINGLLFAIPQGQIPQKQDLEVQDLEVQDLVPWKERFTTALVSNQADDGTWQACGQLPAQKRPTEETQQVTVMWTLLALAQNEITEHASDQALIAIDNDQPKSTEWWVARLLLEDQLGGQVGDLRKRLLATQHDDGGWGWLSDESSDALATGMALYALARTSSSGVTGKELEISLSDARKFLVTTQLEDGSWSVPGTKKSAGGKPTPTSNYWGTGWAVIGLIE